MNLSKRKAEARRAYAEMLAQPAPPKQTRITPEPKGDQKVALGWDRSVPRCETCVHVRKTKTLIHQGTARLPVIIVPPVCLRGRFLTRDTAICDHWTGRDGETLE